MTFSKGGFRAARWNVLLLLVLWAGGIQASEVHFGPYAVHYSVISTTVLSPDVARAYNIRRSGSRALANVTVMERTDSGMKPISAAVSGQAVNLSLQSRPLQFREVRDGEAIYHLAEVPVRPGESLDFRLRVEVSGADPMEIRFRQTLYP